MAHSLTLDSVASAFEHWRNTRRSRREAVPAALRLQAVELLSRYTQIRILKALKINHSMLKRWSQRDAAPKAMGFVPLPLPSTVPVSSSLQITLRNRQGGCMEITGAVSAAQLFSLAQGFAAQQGAKP